MTSVTSTVMMRVGFGKTYHDGHERKKILELIKELEAFLVDLYVLDLWPGLPLVSLVDRLMGKMDRLDKCFYDFDLFYQKLIDEHLNPQNPKSQEEEEDVIDILLRLMKDKLNNLNNLTCDHIKAILMNVLAAGTDTSAATVVWAMTSLMKNPTIMKKAQEEVRDIIGNKGKLDEDDLPKLTYMKAVVKETMRLYPSNPLLVPRETRKDAILQGYKIKQKTIVYLNAWAIGRDPEAWESPEEFRPERFLGQDIDFKGNNFEFIPWSRSKNLSWNVNGSYHGGAFTC